MGVPTVLHRRTSALAGVLVALALLAGACSKDSSSTASAGNDGTTAPSTAAAPAPLKVLVTNDDGVGADGIDAVVEGLRTLPNVEVTVVAPATNQSGTGGKTTDGPLTVTDATTKSGYSAKAVQGFPADTIVWAVDQKGIGFTPDLVVSGINLGQNVGLAVDISGTVGAARAAVTRGIPALASSQGMPAEGGTADFPAGVKEVLAWVTANRSQLQTATVPNLNVPTCNGKGTPKPMATLPVGTVLDLSAQDCTSSLTNPADDVQGLTNGYVTMSALPPTPASRG